MLASSLLDVRPAVAAALKAGSPVVAMVSSPIAHTLPWPANLETVKLADAVVHELGGVLAVVAVWKGRLTVGLELSEVEILARGGSVLRASRRDLAQAVASGNTAATTVSASMYLAWQAGIRLLATGAIGGATHHPDTAEAHLWDISPDMIELSQTPVAVVSAGARSVYHLAYTAEVLETYRVPVVGFATDTFPVFSMRASSHPVPLRIDTPAQVAALLAAHWKMDGAGVVVAQLTPLEVALSPDELLPALHSVEKQASEEHLSRRHLSPFLMDKLNRLTRGKAVRAYQAILVANALLAAQIAQKLLVQESR